MKFKELIGEAMADNSPEIMLSKTIEYIQELKNFEKLKPEMKENIQLVRQYLNNFITKLEKIRFKEI